MAKTATILHLSDLHYQGRENHDISLVTEALVTDLEGLREKSLQPDIIIFSGDLVNAADDDRCYDYFYDNVFEKICKASGCAESRVVLVPGNHDVHRASVEKHRKDLAAFSDSFRARDALNEAYLLRRFDDLLNDQFKGYTDFQRYVSGSSLINQKDLYTVYDFDDLGVQVVAANTAWMSWGGIDRRSDLRQLLYPEKAITDACREIRADRTALLVTHHPLNWLSEDSEENFVAACQSTFRMHFYGHMHQAQPSSVTTFAGKCLHNQAGAMYAGRDRYVGYSVTKIDLSNGHAAVNLQAYSNTRRAFHPAEQLIKGGIFYESEEARQHWRSVSRVVERSVLEQWIRASLLPKAETELNEGLSDRRLCDVFVPPPLVSNVQYHDPVATRADGSAREESVLSFDRLCEKGNYIIHGKSEYGKTTLLKQIALRTLNAGSSDATVPIIVNFGEITPGRDRVIRLLRANIAEDPVAWSVQQLLEEGLITILIDDVVLTDKIRMKILRDFVIQFPRNRFIMTATVMETERFATMPQPEFCVTVQGVFMKPMTRRGMRSLLTQWDSEGRFDKEDMLNKLLNEMTSLNVPITAVNGTILLTIFETQVNFRAINRAVLIENFIEALLDKGSPLSIERKTFDFTNQKHLLSHIAAWMARADCYVVTRREMCNQIQAYLDDRGLANSAESILSTFFSARVFHIRHDDHVSFRYRAFLEYFIASQMRTDGEFRSWVLDDDRYLSFVHEILFYSGIDRADQNLLELISERFDAILSSAFEELKWTQNISALDNFTLPVDTKSAESMLDEFERHMGAPPLDQEEVDDILEADMPQDVESRQEVFRPRATDVGQRVFLGLTLYSGLIRNLELIPNHMKHKHLARILEAWGFLLLASLQIVPHLAKHRRLKLNGVTYEVLAPRHFSEAQIARLIYVGMPSGLSRLIWVHLGTEKLELQLSQKTLDEDPEPGIVTFFRESLRADLRLGQWWKTLAQFGKRSGRSAYLQHILLWKMRELHLMGNVPHAATSEFRGAIADIFAEGRSRTPAEKQRIRSGELNKLERQDLIRRISTSSRSD